MTTAGGRTSRPPAASHDGYCSSVMLNQRQIVAQTRLPAPTPTPFATHAAASWATAPPRPEPLCRAANSTGGQPANEPRKSAPPRGLAASRSVGARSSSVQTPVQAARGGLLVGIRLVVLRTPGDRLPPGEPVRRQRIGEHQAGVRVADDLHVVVHRVPQHELRLLAVDGPPVLCGTGSGTPAPAVPPARPSSGRGSARRSFGEPASCRSCRSHASRCRNRADRRTCETATSAP